MNFVKKCINKPLSFWKQVILNEFELLNKKEKDTSIEKIKWILKKAICFTDCQAWERIGNGIGLFFEVWNLSIDGIVSTDKYIDIPNENLEKSILKMGFDKKWTLQRDNDSKHTATKTKQFLSKLQNRVLQWPLQSRIDKTYWQTNIFKRKTTQKICHYKSQKFQY